MAFVPPGMLSFLYHVMNDTEMNDKFREDPYEVMEFFQLTDDQRRMIYAAGEELVRLRNTKEEERKKRIKERKEAEDKGSNQANTREEYEYDYIYIRAKELEEVYVAVKDDDKILKEGENSDNEYELRELDELLAKVANLLDVYTDYHSKQVKYLLTFVGKELLEGYGRFW